MKKPSMISILLFLTGLLCIIALIFFNRTTLHQILTTEKEVDTISEQITAKHDEVKQAVDKYTTAIDTVQSNINRMKQKQPADQRSQNRNRGAEAERSRFSRTRRRISYAAAQFQRFVQQRLFYFGH